MSFFAELKRRNVFRVGIAYIVAAWLVAQVSELVADTFAAPDWVMPMLLTLLAFGLPVALVFAWAFELTPEGVKREHQVDRSQSIVAHTGRKLDFMIIAALVVALAYFVYESRFVERPGGLAAESAAELNADAVVEASVVDNAVSQSAPRGVAANTVAVLPFVNMSGDAENEYFSDGLTETLLHVLAQIPGLQVAARTSSFAFKGKNDSVTDIAAALGVAHLLEGSVQRANNQVRVTAQLIRAGDGFHVWSQNYTRPLEDIFAIQDEIATDVAKALDASLLGADTQLQSVETSNLNAYETYLKGLEQQALMSYSSLPRAEALFKEALAIDPVFTDAKLALVRNYFLKLNTGMIEQDEADKLSQPLLKQVYLTDPDNRTARVLELVIDTWIDSAMSPQERREKLLEARDLFQYLPTETQIRGPVANAMFWDLGLQDEALAVIEDGLLADPMSPSLQSRRGDLLADMGRLEEGLAATLRAHELSPQDSNIMARVAGVKEKQGDMAGSLEWLRRATVADPGDHELAAILAIDLYRLNLPEAARPWADRVAAQASQTNMGRKVELVRAYALGDSAQAERLARSMISDQVSARFNTYGSAVFIFQEILALQGRDAEGLAYLREVKPELAQYDYPPQDLRDIMTYLAMASFEYMLQPPDELKQIREKLTVLAGKSSDFFSDDPFSLMFSEMMLGNQARASEILLEELLPQPIPMDPGLLESLKLPMFAEVTASPEAQAAINQRQRDTDMIREQVLEQLQQPEWNP